MLVHNEHQPRGFWRLAQVKETIVGKDGQVRGAVLKLPAKNGQTTLLCRPLQLLYPLEINCQMDDQTNAANYTNSVVEGEPELTNKEVLNEGTTRRLSQRAAARQANDRLKACLS